MSYTTELDWKGDSGLVRTDDPEVIAEVKRIEEHRSVGEEDGLQVFEVARQHLELHFPDLVEDSPPSS